MNCEMTNGKESVFCRKILSTQHVREATVNTHHSNITLHNHINVKLSFPDLLPTVYNTAENSAKHSYNRVEQQNQ